MAAVRYDIEVSLCWSGGLRLGSSSVSSVWCAFQNALSGGGLAVIQEPVQGTVVDDVYYLTLQEIESFMVSEPGGVCGRAQGWSHPDEWRSAELKKQRPSHNLTLWSRATNPKGEYLEALRSAQVRVQHYPVIVTHEDDTSIVAITWRAVPVPAAQSELRYQLLRSGVSVRMQDTPYGCKFDLTDAGVEALVSVLSRARS